MSHLKMFCLPLVFALTSTAFAQDATFTKSRYSSAREANEANVILVISDSAVSIRSKKTPRKGSPLDLQIPFSSIDAMSYDLAAFAHWTPVVAPGGGAVPVKTRRGSQWLEIDSHDGSTKQVTVLQLDRSEWQAVLETLKAKSGKPITEAAAGPSAIDPAADSEDLDEVIPYSTAAISSALKPAMESVGCNVTKTAADQVECKRARGASEVNGVGGEKVTAKLDAQGANTRIQISTGKGFYGRLNKRNWSKSIFDQLMIRLKESAAAAPPPGPN